MCSACQGKKVLNSVRTTTRNNCNGARKRLIRVKNKAYTEYKNNNSLEDKEIYDSVATDLRNLRYCPTEQELEVYESRHGL